MKTILSLSILFCVIALPTFGQLIETDLNKIRLIINEEIKKENTRINQKIDALDAKIDTLDTRIQDVEQGVAWVRGKLEGIDKQVTHGINITYGLIALIVAAVAIPQILIMLRSSRDRALERQVEKLTQEVETLKQQRIVNP